MQILKILSQHRRDFTAELICEYCNTKEEKSGYDDEYLHKHVIPKMKCLNCGKVASASYEAETPKYAANQTI